MAKTVIHMYSEGRQTRIQFGKSKIQYVKEQKASVIAGKEGEGKSVRWLTKMKLDRQ